MITYTQIGGLRCVTGELDSWRSLFNDDDRNVISLLLEINSYQLGEGSLPDGMNYKQAMSLVRSERARQLAAISEKWYIENGGTGFALLGPFGVGK